MSLIVALCALGQVGAMQETAVINLVRHGEKCKGCGTGLTVVGKHRAQYLANCMSSSRSSEVMPYGEATAVMASQVRQGESTRPRDTAAPLARNLGLELQQPCDKKDADCFAQHVRSLIGPRDTVVAAWQHEDIPSLAKALGVEVKEQSFKKWPKKCPSTSFKEPACVYGDSEHINATTWCGKSLWCEPTALQSGKLPGSGHCKKASAATPSAPAMKG
eukprot:s1176_g3.t1